MEDYNPFSENKRILMTIVKKLDLLLRLFGKVDLHDEFNIEGLSKAAKILGYKSTKTLKKKIKKGDVLKENIHYRITDTNRYFFSERAILSVKGRI